MTPTDPTLIIAEHHDAINQLIDQIAATWGRDATPYRTAGGQWAVSLGSHLEPGHVVLSADTFTEALIAAATRAKLPVIPRCPPYPGREPTITRNGSRWRVDGWFGWFETATKKQALARIETITAGTWEAINNWHAQYDRLVRSGTENIDYYYAR